VLFCEAARLGEIRAADEEGSAEDFAAAASGAGKVFDFHPSPTCGWLCFGRRLFTRHDDPRDRLAHGNDVAHLRLYAGENSLRWGFYFDDCLIGFDFEERLTLGNGFTFFFSPSQELYRFPAPFRGRALRCCGP